jgi:hypothetical protein
LMNSGVGRFDSPKYSFSTPSIDMAISASSRMRECGTASAEAATDGANLAMGLDTFENRRCGNAEAGENFGINERLIVTEPCPFTKGIFDANQPLLWIDCPE